MTFLGIYYCFGTIRHPGSNNLEKKYFSSFVKMTTIWDHCASPFPVNCRLLDQIMFAFTGNSSASIAARKAIPDVIVVVVDDVAVRLLGNIRLFTFLLFPPSLSGKSSP